LNAGKQPLSFAVKAKMFADTPKIAPEVASAA
jgi:hypothetical protein